MAKQMGRSPFLDRKAYGFERIILAARLAQGRIVVAANLLARKVRENLNKPGSGRIYRSRTGSGLHQASAPGQPPAPGTRRLRKSVRVKDEGIGRGARVSVKAPGAATLEFGNRSGTLKPRPYLRKSFDESKTAMTAVLVTAVDVTLRPVWMSI